jgi:hypothetical protein
MSADPRVPIGSVLPGFELHPLEPAWTPLQAFVLVKSLDQDGDVAWAFRTSENMNLEELLGALTVQARLLSNQLVTSWEDQDPDRRADQ